MKGDDMSYKGDDRRGQRGRRDADDRLDAETAARIAVFEEQLKSLGTKFTDIMHRFTKHMEIEEESFKGLRSELKNMDNELKAAFKERDEKYIKMAEKHAAKEADHNLDIANLKLEYIDREAVRKEAHNIEIKALEVKQARIYTAASVIVVCIGLVAKFA